MKRKWKFHNEIFKISNNYHRGETRSRYYLYKHSIDSVNIIIGEKVET